MRRNRKSPPSLSLFLGVSHPESQPAREGKVLGDDGSIIDAQTYEEMQADADGDVIDYAMREAESDLALVRVELRHGVSRMYAARVLRKLADTISRHPDLLAARQGEEGTFKDGQPVPSILQCTYDDFGNLEIPESM